MKRYLMKINFVLAVAGSFIACAQVDSSDLKGDAISTNYQVEYSEDSDQLEFTASFTAGNGFGSTVELSGDSGVTLDAVKLRKSTDLFGDIDYVRKISRPGDGDLQSEHVFQYTNHEGQVYTNTVRLPGAIRLNNAVSANAVITVDWAADVALERTESVSVYLSSRNNSYNKTDTNAAGKAGRVTMSAEEIAHVAGDVYIQICRSSHTNYVSAPAAGGSIFRRYCSRAQKL